MKTKKFLSAVILLLVSISSAWADSFYDSAPSYTYPHYAGELKASVLNEALAELNHIREIVGVPAAVTLNDDYNSKAQHGAVLLDVLNMGLTHTPGKPSGMDESFYQEGYAGTSHGNIAYGWSSSGLGMDIVKSLRLYMDDSDNYNISSLGHRRWLMNPRLKQVGFGLATRNGYSVTYVIEDIDYNETKKWPISDEFISWPTSKNTMPLSYFDDDMAWSVTLNPEVFNTIGSSVKVTLTRLRDNKKWNFSYSSYDGYFNVDKNGYAWDECIIFRPGSVDDYNSGEKWRVEISGLTRKSGGSENINYTVTFGASSSDDSDDYDYDSDDEDYESEDDDYEVVKEVVNDKISLMPIDADRTKTKLANALGVDDISGINFITNGEISDPAESKTAMTAAEKAGFTITRNYKSITAETGVNAFKIYATDIIRKAVGEIKIYLAKKDISGSSFTASKTGDVIEAELFDPSGVSLTDLSEVPEQILVKADITDAGDYSVHLAEKISTLPVDETDKDTNTETDGTDSSSGCDAGFGLLALLILGIPRVKPRWSNK